MSLTSAMIDALLAAGGTAEQLAAMVKAGIAEEEARKAAKRENNAERQRRFKQKRRSREGNGDNESNALPSVTPPIEEIIPPEQSSPSGEACLPKRKSAALHYLPDDWEPILTAASQRVVDGWPPGFYERQLSAFRNHAADKGRKSKDWQAAFRTWLDNADKWNQRDGRPLRPADTFAGIRGTRPNPALDMVLQAERELAAEAERQNQGADWPARIALPPH